MPSLLGGAAVVELPQTAEMPALAKLNHSPITLITRRLFRRPSNSQ
jgi:hypothetical protein